jgi:hypothetical protein
MSTLKGDDLQLLVLPRRHYIWSCVKAEIECSIYQGSDISILFSFHPSMMFALIMTYEIRTIPTKSTPFVPIVLKIYHVISIRSGFPQSH